MLKDTQTAPPPEFSIERLADITDGLSGSDLKETCRNAAMKSVREFLQQHSLDPQALQRAQEKGFQLRPVTLRDFVDSEVHAAPIPGGGADTLEPVD